MWNQYQAYNHYSKNETPYPQDETPSNPLSKPTNESYHNHLIIW
jgi:hypothetical protein